MAEILAGRTVSEKIFMTLISTKIHIFGILVWNRLRRLVLLIFRRIQLHSVSLLYPKIIGRKIIGMTFWFHITVRGIALIQPAIKLSGINLIQKEIIRGLKIL